MKELSIEEKAKRYDEILARAKGANIPYYKEDIMSKVKEFVDYLLPELIESEDEKISKEILAFINLKKSLGSMNQEQLEKSNSWIAWLEKLGEQKPVPKFKIGDTMRTLQEAKDGFTDGMPVIVSIDEEYYHCTNELIAIKDQDDYEYPPTNRIQNSTEWSEEDECNVINICAHLRSVLTNETVEKYRNWFVILRQKLSNVERNGKNWKPSKEQIKALEKVTYYSAFPDAKYCVDLKSLLEQLKAL